MTLVELLIAMAVASVVLALSLTLAVTSKRIFDDDRRRVGTDQTLRGAVDMLGRDIRQAGELLGGRIPGIQILSGTHVVSGTELPADTLILRSGLTDTVLPVCETVQASTAPQVVKVADPGKPALAPRCSGTADGDGDGWPDDLQSWRAFRQTAGGTEPPDPSRTLRAYLFNPTTRYGEFVTILQEDASATVTLVRNGSGSAFPIAHRPELHVLTERRYALIGDRLVLTVDDVEQPAAADLASFSVLALRGGGTPLDTYDDTQPGATDLTAIEVALRARPAPNGPVSRGLTDRFFPRNILTR